MNRSNGRLALVAASMLAITVAVAACGGDPAHDDAGVAIDAAGTCSVNTFKELMIVKPSVVGDATRNSSANDGHWSFRFLMEQMAPATMDPAVFTSDMMMQWATVTKVNGFAVDKRSAGITSFLAAWPKRSDGKLDLSKSPFKLIALVYRPDLASSREPAGEGRLVFGANNGSPEPFTVIFEYRLPTAGGQTFKTWADRFHSLGSVAFGSTYNADLQAITDLFTERNTSPTRINGSSISQVRTNEIQLDGFWELREFRLRTSGLLLMNETRQAPDESLNPHGGTPNAAQAALIAWINSNASAILAGTDTVPTTFLGGDQPEVGQPWDFGTRVDPTVRKAFATNTCVGCHNGEVQQIGGFYQIDPLVAPGTQGTSMLSNFLLLSDLPKRNAILKNAECGAPIGIGGRVQVPPAPAD